MAGGSCRSLRRPPSPLPNGGGGGGGRAGGGAPPPPPPPLSSARLSSAPPPWLPPPPERSTLSATQRPSARLIVASMWRWPLRRAAKPDRRSKSVDFVTLMRNV